MAGSAGAVRELAEGVPSGAGSGELCRTDLLAASAPLSAAAGSPGSVADGNSVCPAAGESVVTRSASGPATEELPQPVADAKAKATQQTAVIVMARDMATWISAGMFGRIGPAAGIVSAVVVSRKS